jgi:hypothetical protein
MADFLDRMSTKLLMKLFRMLQTETDSWSCHSFEHQVDLVVKELMRRDAPRWAGVSFDGPETVKVAYKSGRLDLALWILRDWEMPEFALFTLFDSCMTGEGLVWAMENAVSVSPVTLGKILAPAIAKGRVDDVETICAFAQRVGIVLEGYAGEGLDKFLEDEREKILRSRAILTSVRGLPRS